MEEATAKNKMTVAAIDLGSNTFRLLIAGSHGNVPAVLLKRNATVKLGRGLSAASGLAPDTMTAALAVLGGFKEDLARYRVARCRCCGTEALRRAANAKAFLDSAAAVLGTEIEVISGREEALLACRGALAALTGTAISFPLLIIDVGGSSTELIYLSEAAAAPLTTSLPAGAVLFTELAAAGCLQPAVGVFKARLRGFIDKFPSAPARLSVVGVGGTATALAVLDLALDHYQGHRVHGHELTAAGIMNIALDLATMPASTRDFLPGLEQGRGAILSAGLEIYQEILATIGVGGMIISDAGLLEGIMLSCLEQTPGALS